MSLVQIIVPGDPVPWQRARSVGKRRFKAPQVVEYEERVQAAWLVEGRPSFDANTPLAVSATFFFGRKDSHLKKSGGLKASAPAYPPRVDTDNLVKGVTDALNGRLYHDDSQIVLLDRVRKCYVENGAEPRTELEVRAL